MRDKMPKSVKTALMLACAAFVLCVVCELAQEAVFIKRFLGYADGLNHKSVILAEPVTMMASILIGAAFLIALIVALALGKSWARKLYIVLAVLQFLSVGLNELMLLLSSMHPGLAVATQNLNRTAWWDWVNVIIDIPVVILLFTHGSRAWYRADVTPENKWRNRFQCLVYIVLGLVFGVVVGVVCGVASGIANPYKVADKFPRIRVAQLHALADQGDAPSMWRLGNWEKNGWLGEKHPDTAVEWYKKAADLGDRGALNDLGDCYEKGIGTETNLEEAVSCWMKAAEKKHSWAACKVAIRHQKDEKQKEAFEWFKKSADLGNDYGCCKLGECYERGWGAETNATLAAEWFLKGAERRHSWGMEKTGDFYRDGYGVEKDLDKARKWYEKAVKRGNKNAQKKLDALPAEDK